MRRDHTHTKHCTGQPVSVFDCKIDIRLNHIERRGGSVFLVVFFPPFLGFDSFVPRSHLSLEGRGR